MKKIFIGMLAAAAVLTACDPSKDNINTPEGSLVSAEQLAEGLTFTQYALDAEGNYVPAADGNFIKFATSPSTVVKVYTVGEDGSETVLSSGFANGMFLLAPARGGNPVQEVFFMGKSWDGTEVVTSKTLTVAVASELTPEMLLACSNSGQKTWMWDTADGGAVWGNFGYTADSGENFADTRAGEWWGVKTTEEFAGQQEHRGADAVRGDDDMNATMVMYEDGSIKCFDASGVEIRSGKFSIDYDPTNKKIINSQAWSVGQLNVSNGAILWPYAINTGGYMPEKYEIVRLTANQLVLTYAAENTGSWAEATFWRFRCDTDHEGVLTTAPNGWTWDSADGKEVWGNMGYRPSDNGADVYKDRAGQWWGVKTTEEFAGQSNHRGSDPVVGDGDLNAYMIFGTDGKVTSYDGSGKQIRQADYTIINTAGDTWKPAVFQVEGADGGILFPFEINSGGNHPKEYDVVYMDLNHFVLVYPDKKGTADESGSWGEATFWRFARK